MNLGQIVVIGLSVAFAVWLAGGIWYNRRRTQQIWRWLEAGLDVFGGRVGKMWMGGSGAGLRAAIDNPPAPFRRIELIVQLESRENPPLWLFELVQGKRDQLTFRGWLRSPGRWEVELVAANNVSDWDLQTQAAPPWQRMNLSPGWVIAHRGNIREEQVEAVQAFVITYGRHLQRFSKRRTEPDLFVQMSIDALTGEPSQKLLSRIKATVSD